MAAPVLDNEENDTAEETAEILDEEVPMAAPAAGMAEAQGTGSWALMNLIASILTVFAGIWMILAFIFKKRDENEEEAYEAEAETEEETRRKKSKLFGIIPAALSVIVFILTENMANPMVLTDRWTVLMVLILLANIVLLLFTSGRKSKEEETEEVCSAETAAA